MATPYASVDNRPRSKYRFNEFPQNRLSEKEAIEKEFGFSLWLKLAQTICGMPTTVHFADEFAKPAVSEMEELPDSFAPPPPPPPEDHPLAPAGNYSDAVIDFCTLLKGQIYVSR